MKKLFPVLAAALILSGCGDPEPIDPPDTIDVLSMIPDPVFRSRCESQMETWDTNGDGKLSPTEAAKVTEMYVRYDFPLERIVSLEGIEHFTGLTSLSCRSNRLTALDLSKNTALTRFVCSDNLLKSIDISNNTALTLFQYSGNPGEGIPLAFTVKAWFDNASIPWSHTSQWVYEGATVIVDYQKVR